VLLASAAAFWAAAFSAGTLSEEALTSATSFAFASSASFASAGACEMSPPLVR
jgi:hypothetical protein